MLKIEHDVIGICATNTYYMYDTDTLKAVIIDPAGDYMRIIDHIKRLGIRPLAILVTHGHFDHILAVPEIRREYRIPVYIADAEKNTLRDETANLSTGFIGQGITIEADAYLMDNDEFMVGDWKIRAILTPGHTPGGMCYYFDKDGVLFSGDTLFCESVGRSDFPGGSGSAIRKSVIEKLLILPDDTRVYPGHMEETTISHEKKYNPFCM